MEFNVISSGSKGNATIVISQGQVILIDFGISKKRISDALSEYGFSFDDLSAVFITHSHSDHCKEVKKAPIEKLFASTMALPSLDQTIPKDHILKNYATIRNGVFSITVLPLSHDAKNTVGFLIDDGREKLCYVTDTGFVPEKDFPYLTDLDYYIFESNHDPKMLYESKRPDYLIRRIISDKGHLSNIDSSYYLTTLIGPKTKEIVLAHLSDECNTPELALKAFDEVFMTQMGCLPECKVEIASEFHETRGGKNDD
ncbi:MAG: MBL fold metallo-hydrolase [Bacilli bacterium]